VKVVASCAIPLLPHEACGHCCCGEHWHEYVWHTGTLHGRVCVSHETVQPPWNGTNCGADDTPSMICTR
jgi:hypothetical protein